MASSQTKLAKLGIGATDPVDTYLRFMDFDPGVRRELRNTQATGGTFFTDVNTTRESRRSVTPRFSSEPTSLELAALLTWIMGTPTGTTTLVYTPPNAPTLRNLHWFPVAGEPFFLTGCGVDNATLAASVGEPLSVDIEAVGTTHDVSHSSFPAISPDVVLQPFMLSDLTASGGVFSFGGSTRQPAGLSIRISNFIDRGRFLNSLELTRVQKMDMAFGVSFDVPSGDNTGLWSAGMNPASPVSMTATFVNPGNTATLSITAAGILFPAQAPRHARGGEGMVTIDGMMYRTGGTGSPISIAYTPPA